MALKEFSNSSRNVRGCAASFLSLRQIGCIGEPRHPQHVEFDLFLKRVQQVLSLRDLLHLRGQRAGDTCKAEVERSNVGGIAGAHTDKLMIDDGCFEADSLLRNVDALDTEPSVPSP